MNLSVARAYVKHEDYSAAPVTHDNRRQRFITHFLCRQFLLCLDRAKTQMEAFEVEINGLRYALAKMLGSSKRFADKIGMYVEAEFVTYESPEFFVIGRFRDSKIQLVHEKKNSPILYSLYRAGCALFGLRCIRRDPSGLSEKREKEEAEQNKGKTLNHERSGA